MGYSEAGGLPYEMGLVKNKYIGRTFIQPSQTMREKGVRMKLSPVKSIVRGKRVVLVDDSIVRGTTSGVDISTYDELICARKSIEEVRRSLEADSLAFLSEEALFRAGRRSEMCLACFDGRYPTPLYQSIENANKDGKF